MTSGFPLGQDMSRPRAEGYKAFKDGASINTCPHAAIDPKRTEWRDGYEKAQRDQEKRDEKFR
jgi:ribosome modulation factor